MIALQVNRHVALALALSVACAPAGNKSSETAASRTDTTHIAAAPPDSNITRADLARIQGSTSAPLWVIEVSDFQCPYCKQWHDQTYNAFLDQYVKNGKVRLAYVNFPLGIHANAWPAAEAAMCAGAQNKFWAMHDSLFASQTRWEALANPSAVFDSLARATGNDLTKWRDCVKSGKMKPLIQADHDRAQQAGVGATPSFIIGDKLLTGAQPLSDMQRVIDSALVKSKKTTS
ncbi:MAG TPA: thioredoxin domain-containing protein [Gemmatimonadaceae bacterium]|nr:thioredoxin domain-containing protein [Gemmatimonadaceae bacterium]